MMPKMYLRIKLHFSWFSHHSVYPKRKADNRKKAKLTYRSRYMNCESIKLKVIWLILTISSINSVTFGFLSLACINKSVDYFERVNHIRLIASFLLVVRDLQAKILKSTMVYPIFRFKNDLESNEAFDVYSVSIRKIQAQRFYQL